MSQHHEKPEAVDSVLEALESVAQEELPPPKSALERALQESLAERIERRRARLKELENETLSPEASDRIWARLEAQMPKPQAAPARLGTKPLEKIIENGRAWLLMSMETLNRISGELEPRMRAAYRRGPGAPLAFRERTLGGASERWSAAGTQDQGGILNSEPLQGFDWVPFIYEPDPEDGATIITLKSQKDISHAPEPAVRVTLDGEAIAPDDWEYMPESGKLRLEFNRLLPERVELRIGAVSAERPVIEIALAALPQEQEAEARAPQQADATSAEPARPLAAAAEVARGIYQQARTGWTTVTQSLLGIETAEHALAPGALLGPSGDDLQAAFAQAEVPLVIQSMLRTRDGLVLVVRWLAPLPAREPKLKLRIQGRPADHPLEWTDWLQNPDRGQELTIQGLDLDPEAQDDRSPLAALSWNPEAETLEIHLLPATDH